ncbi:MAG: hypothetical protein ICV60_15105 [Pyrinomonadaceae bacterium]|nr:hypothetical protein [Pyrinomonadaceae bacterium]
MSEPVTIYLAAGASFGVSRYLHALGSAKSRSRAIAEGIAAALLWPLAAAAILSKRLRHACDDGPTEDAQADAVRARVEDAKRNLINSVNRMLEALRASRVTVEETLEQALYVIREGAEQYVGLKGMLEDADEQATPEAYESELARVSGRRGLDLLIAARCVHRRNVSRLRAHYHMERTRLLGKLAELRAHEDGSLSYVEDARAARRKISEARLEVYLRATALFSLVEDESAARCAAQLTDAECLTLRRLRETNEAATKRAFGVEKCTEHAPHLISKDPLRATTFTQG